MLPDEQLHWGFLESDDFFYGPNNSSSLEEK